MDFGTKNDVFTEEVLDTHGKQYYAMDEAVLHACGWTDIVLRHGFHEVEYLPENDRTRRDEEEADGLWDKGNKKKGKVKVSAFQKNIFKTF